MSLDVNELVELTWPELEPKLRMMTRVQVLEVFNAMAESDSLTATKIVEAEGVNRVHLVDRVCGNPSKGLSGMDRSFMIGPVEKGDVIELEAGSHEGRRRYQKISQPIPLPAKRAILALDLYGPKAPFSENRNRLREYSPDELADFYAQKPKPKAKADDKKDAKADKGKSSK